MARYFWIGVKNTSVEKILDVLSLKAMPPIEATGNDGLFLVHISSEWTVVCSSDGSESGMFKEGLILEEFEETSVLLIASETVPMAFFRILYESLDIFDLHADPKLSLEELRFIEEPPEEFAHLLASAKQEVQQAQGIPYDAVVKFANGLVGFAGPYSPLPEGTQIIPVKRVRRRAKKTGK